MLKIKRPQCAYILIVRHENRSGRSVTVRNVGALHTEVTNVRMCQIPTQ